MQTDGWTDMTKVTVTFPDFAKAPKNNNDRVINNVQNSSFRVGRF
jgi:Fe-S-cluster formation regulator IscX/YfhJ